MGDVVDELRRRLPYIHQCKDCEKWYGQEDEDHGPCAYKNARGEKKYLTYGFHECDEEAELRERIARWKATSESEG